MEKGKLTSNWQSAQCIPISLLAWNRPWIKGPQTQDHYMLNSVFEMNTLILRTKNYSLKVCVSFFVLSPSLKMHPTLETESKCGPHPIVNQFIAGSHQSHVQMSSGSVHNFSSYDGNKQACAVYSQRWKTLPPPAFVAWGKDTTRLGLEGQKEDGLVI